MGAYLASKQAARMLTWAIADRPAAMPVTANALNPAYVLTDQAKNVGELLKVVVTLTTFRAQSPLDDADTAIWLAGSPDVEGITGKFWNKRQRVRCRLRHPSAVHQLATLVEQQLAGHLMIAATPCSFQVALDVNSTACREGRP
jgi:retinol dehydrogenase 12